MKGWGLPPRLRLTKADELWSSMQMSSMTKRELLKRLFKGWRSLGNNYPCGYISPNRSACIRGAMFVASFTKAARNGEINIEAIMRGQFDDNFLNFLERNGRSI